MNVATSDRTFQSLRPWLVFVLGRAGSVVLVVLLARTAVGAVDEAPGPWLTAILTAIGFTVAMAVWWLDGLDRTPHDRRSRITRLAAVWLAALLFGLLVAQENAAGVAAVTAVALTWAFVVACYEVRSVKYRSESTSAPSSVANTVVGLTSGNSNRAGGDAGLPTRNADTRRPEPDLELSDAGDRALRLQLRRSVTPDGETIDIQARLEFAAGAREAVLHVPFWPALASPPQVECEPLDSDDVELRCTSAERYGLRIEARLPAATATARPVLIGVEVRAAAATGGLSAAA